MLRATLICKQHILLMKCMCCFKEAANSSTARVVTLISPDNFLFAPAGVEHGFENFTDDFILLVIFYRHEGGEVDARALYTIIIIN